MFGFDTVIGTLLLGAALIGLAAGLLTLLTGRILTASGMIGSLLGGAEGLAATSIAFIGGIVAAPLLMTTIGFLPQRVTEADMAFLVTGGLLVGFAARFGGASLFGALTGVARGSRHAAVMVALIFAGAGIAALLQNAFGLGGAA